MLRYVFTHELAEYLGRRFILCPADLQELLPEAALNPNA